jgi:hypothetical protein
VAGAAYPVRAAEGGGYELRNGQGEVYLVTGDGRCGCKSWWYRRRLDGTDCKHIRALREAHLLEARVEEV